MRVVSDTATPMVFSPRSSPIHARSGRAGGGQGKEVQDGHGRAVGLDRGAVKGEAGHSERCGANHACPDNLRLCSGGHAGGLRGSGLETGGHARTRRAGRGWTCRSGRNGRTGADRFRRRGRSRRASAGADRRTDDARPPTATRTCNGRPRWCGWCRCEDQGAKLFATAGGDPAVNGLYTYMAFFAGPADGWTRLSAGRFPRRRWSGRSRRAASIWRSPRTPLIRGRATSSRPDGASSFDGHPVPTARRRRG